VHVLEVAPELTGDADADPVVNHATIEHELAAHDERLAQLPRVLALSKCDLLDELSVSAAVAAWQERLGEQTPVIATSSATGAGLQQLAAELLRRVPALTPASVRAGAGETGQADTGDGARAGSAVRTDAGESEALAEHMVFRPGAASGFTVQQLRPGAFAVRGRGIERLLARYDVDNDDAMAHFEGRLRRIGVLKALEAEGFQPGDEIEIAGETFELDPDAPA